MGEKKKHSGVLTQFWSHSGGHLTYGIVWHETSELVFQAGRGLDDHVLVGRLGPSPSECRRLAYRNVQAAAYPGVQ